MVKTKHNPGKILELSASGLKGKTMMYRERKKFCEHLNPPPRGLKGKSYGS